MGRRRSDVLPAMRRCKGGKHARVRLGGREYYLGPWGSAEARVEYHRLVAAWLKNGDSGREGDPLPPAPTATKPVEPPTPPAFERLTAVFRGEQLLAKVVDLSGFLLRGAGRFVTSAHSITHVRYARKVISYFPIQNGLTAASEVDPTCWTVGGLV